MKQCLRQMSLLLLLVVACVGCGEKQQSPARSEPVPTQISYPKVPSFSLPDINGNTVQLEDFQGKVVLLDFFATWCEPCRVTIPAFIELYHKYQPKGFVVVGISTDHFGLEVVKPFVEELKIDYPVLIGNSEVVKAYRVIGLPTSFILDRLGHSRKYHLGIQPKEVFEREILEILSE